MVGGDSAWHMPTLAALPARGTRPQNGNVLPQQPHYLTFFVTLPRWFGVDA
ncbi:hypothetical protein SRABI112_02530 [Pseudomonas mediterranea]|uniref:Diguanylate cyclase n=1 Tax=Pseudomonas mediterranea TaxID=183795 RepID=A0AAX2D8R4_9PSED|nr:hypothetical protein SRABI112_02530 [Pseudomonas mediterranea]SDU33215.1 hypothetical protein SAMN05216476_1508 [Pseudomonas mediterranea]